MGWHTPLKSPLHHHYRQHLPINICVGKGGVRAKKSKGTDHCDGQSLPHTQKQKKQNKTHIFHSYIPQIIHLPSFPYFSTSRPCRMAIPPSSSNKHNTHHHSFLFIFPNYSYFRPLPTGTGVFLPRQIACFLAAKPRTFFLRGYNNKPLIGLIQIIITIPIHHNHSNRHILCVRGHNPHSKNTLFVDSCFCFVGGFAVFGGGLRGEKKAYLCCFLGREATYPCRGFGQENPRKFSSKFVWEGEGFFSPLFGRVGWVVAVESGHLGRVHALMQRWRTQHQPARTDWPAELLNGEGQSPFPEEIQRMWLFLDRTKKSENFWYSKSGHFVARKFLAILMTYSNVQHENLSILQEISGGLEFSGDH